MKSRRWLFSLSMMLCMSSVVAGNTTSADKENDVTEKAETPKKSRFTLGGYGEAVYTRNFYSDNINRYSKAEDYKDAKGHGQFDLPHVVIMLGYDFGKGWTMGTEIEFEHGGTESAVEMEQEEVGEWEKEIERGGEIALEQFWIQKSFCPEFNIRAGHIIVPVGYTNAHHLPTEFFGVYRPEGENTIMPCTWHQTGVSLWGRVGDWRYEALLIPALNSMNFSKDEWIKNGASSAFEFTPGNKIAGAVRIDNYSVPGLRMGISAYYGESFGNTLQTDAGKYKDVKGEVIIGTFDFDYKGYNWIVRGNADYGYLGDAAAISDYNRIQSSTSPYKRTLVGKNAVSAGIEAGYDIFSRFNKLRGEQKMYIFGRYEYYDAYVPVSGYREYSWTNRKRMAVGLNYYPIKDIVVKAEYSKRFFKSQYNDEPSFSLGIAYAGFFNL